MTFMIVSVSLLAVGWQFRVFDVEMYIASI